MFIIPDSTSSRGPSVAPGVSPCFRADDDPHTLTYSGRAVRGEGREKHKPDPAWNVRLAAIGGRDLFGRPQFRATWGWNELQGNGELRFPHVASRWLVLRRFPASAWGARDQWYEPRIDDGAWAPSYADSFGEDYPYAGGEEIFFAFPPGTPFNLPYVEYRLYQFVNRPKLASREQRIKDARREIEAEEQAVVDRDYERFVSATQPFAGEPFVGYGQKSAPVKSKAKVMPASFRRKFNEMHAEDMARFKRQGRKVRNV